MHALEGRVGILKSFPAPVYTLGQVPPFSNDFLNFGGKKSQNYSQNFGKIQTRKSHTCSAHASFNVLPNLKWMQTNIPLDLEVYFAVIFPIFPFINYL